MKAKDSSNTKDYAAAEAKADLLKTQYEDEMMKFEAAKVRMTCNAHSFEDVEMIIIPITTL